MKDQSLRIKVSERFLERVDQEAEKRGLNRSQLTRIALENELSKREVKIMTREQMINEMKGSNVIVDYEWLKENDTETLAYIQESNYCDFQEEETILEVQFDEGGTRYYACAEWADCDTPSQNQPPWFEDGWEDWETEDIEKYYNEMKK